VAIPPIQVGEGLVNLAFTCNQDQIATATRPAQEPTSVSEAHQPAINVYIGSQDQSLGQVYASRTGIVASMFATSELRKDYEQEPHHTPKRNPARKQRKAD
jgi:hypothetical protein